MKVNMEFAFRLGFLLLLSTIELFYVKSYAVLVLLSLGVIYMLTELATLSYERKRLDGRTNEAVFLVWSSVYEQASILGGSLVNALRKSSSLGLSGTGVGYATEELAARISLGLNLDQAIHSTNTTDTIRRDINRLVGYGNGDDLLGMIGSGLKRDEEMELDRIESAGYSMQKYLTLSMVSGTVIPSLALFGFTAYSITGASGALAPIFTIGFGGLMPFFYRIVRIRTAGLIG
jgi:hypothetical protein